MRFTRRSLLIGAGSALAGAAIGGSAMAQRPSSLPGPTPIEVRATTDPLPFACGPGAASLRLAGFPLRSRPRSRISGFGGFSGLSRSPDGRNLVALADNAQWLTASVDLSDDGRLAGLSDAIMAPLLGEDGRPMRRTRYYDTEGLTLSGGAAYVSTERSPALFRFDWARDGVSARAQPLPVPAELRSLPSNGGLEALGVAPARSPLAGALVAIAEQSHQGPDAPTTGFILSGGRRGSFRVARSADFAVTDLVFLATGDMLLLERRFSLMGGLECRLRRIPAGALRPNGLLDGPVIFQSDPSMQIDNMEGMALHRDGRETVITMISDDNFSAFQRTLLLEFALAE